MLVSLISQLFMSIHSSFSCSYTDPPLSSPSYTIPLPPIPHLHPPFCLPTQPSTHLTHHSPPTPPPLQPPPSPPPKSQHNQHNQHPDRPPQTPPLREKPLSSLLPAVHLPPPHPHTNQPQCRHRYRRQNLSVLGTDRALGDELGRKLAPG